MASDTSESLTRDPMGLIYGKWVAASSGGHLAVVNPATGQVLAEVPDMGIAETTAAVEAADRAMSTVPSPEQRRGWLGAIHQLLMDHRESLAHIITLEQGKPLREAVVEVEYAAGFFRYYAATLDTLQTQRLQERPRNCAWTIHHRPAGVAALISPWNFPLAMLAKKLAPALAAGCAAVIKPSELTPLTCVALFRLLERVGMPDGTVNMVVGRPEAIGQVFCTHPSVRVISFTGSTAVGKKLAAQAAPHLKRLSLELGGNAPFIVFDDAAIPAAVDGLMASKFRAAGQTCVCANRVYVQRGALEHFLAALAPRVAALRVGNGLEEGVDIGPLINRAAFEKVDRHVRDALAHGARRLVGRDAPAPPGSSPGNWGAFYPPTLLTAVKPEMALCREETFGPVVGVSEFSDEEEVIRLANSTPYGLAAYVFSADTKRLERVVARLYFGHVGVNTGTGPTPEAPFGGMKESGYGREGGLEGLAEFIEPQTVAEG